MNRKDDRGELAGRGTAAEAHFAEPDVRMDVADGRLDRLYFGDLRDLLFDVPGNGFL